MYLFRSFLVNLSIFRAILNMKSRFFSNFDKNWASRSSYWHRYIQFLDCFACLNKSSSVLKNTNLEKICSFYLKNCYSCQFDSYGLVYGGIWLHLAFAVFCGLWLNMAYGSPTQAVSSHWHTVRIYIQGDFLIIGDVAETFSHRTRESNFEIYR